MFYIKESKRIYDFANLIMKFNGKINDLYEKTKQDLILNLNKKSSLNEVFNFVKNIAKNRTFDEEEIKSKFYDKFVNENFLNKFIEEFKDKLQGNNNDNQYLKILDGNKCVELINDFDKKFGELNKRGNLLNILDLGLNCISDYLMLLSL